MSDASDRDDALSAELGAWLALTSTAAAPDEALGARLMRSLRTTHRFEHLEARVATLLDVSRADAAAMLLAIDEGGGWAPALGPDVELFHVEGGPAVANAITGFVRMAPGTEFPEHEHLGDETVLVLQGSCEDASGEVFHPGDVAAMRAGTKHHLRATGSVRLMFLAVIADGLVVDGVTLRPGDPRA